MHSVSWITVEDIATVFKNTWKMCTCVSFFSVATRIEQRKKMNCKSFRWYLENVYPELT